MGDASKGSPIHLELADSIVRDICAELSSYCKIEVVGSVRRRKPVVNDIDILIHASPEINKITVCQIIKEKFCYRVLVGDGSSTCQKMSVLYDIDGDEKTGEVTKVVQIDFNFCDNLDVWGAQLFHHTGPAEYNIRLRRLAMKKGMMLSQYGLVVKDLLKVVAADTEEHICKELGCTYREPKDRQ